MESKSERNLEFNQWLQTACPQGVEQCLPMPHDASWRRYYRVKTPAGSFVAMDAPPPENCIPFVVLARAFLTHGLHVPKIYAEDVQHGFLLLSDFGDTTFLKARRADLYPKALDALVKLQACREIPLYELPIFGNDWLQKEWLWHKEWFLEKWLEIQGPVPDNVEAAYQILVMAAMQQPQVTMHRDFHSANLMVLPNDEVGILDFQDAFLGPLTYDPASFLRDCYIDWSTEQVTEWALYYAHQLRAKGYLNNVDDLTFLRWFDFMGMQRHLKALMTFARKAVRDNQPGYLRHIPRTLHYLIDISAKYPELQALNTFYSKQVSAALNKKEILCAP